MAGNHPSSISYVMTRAQPSLSSSPRLAGSLEDSLDRVGVEVKNISKIGQHSYFQWIENRFTVPKMLMEPKPSIVIPVVAQALEDTH